MIYALYVVSRVISSEDMILWMTETKVAHLDLGGKSECLDLFVLHSQFHDGSSFWLNLCASDWINYLHFDFHGTETNHKPLNSHITDMVFAGHRQMFRIWLWEVYVAMSYRGKPQLPVKF